MTIANSNGYSYTEYVYSCIFNEKLWMNSTIQGENSLNYNDFSPYNPIDCDIDNDSDGSCLTSVHNFMYNYVHNPATSTEGYTCEDNNCYMH